MGIYRRQASAEWGGLPTCLRAHAPFQMEKQRQEIYWLLSLICLSLHGSLQPQTEPAKTISVFYFSAFLSSHSRKKPDENGITTLIHSPHAGPSE